MDKKKGLIIFDIDNTLLIYKGNFKIFDDLLVNVLQKFNVPIPPPEERFKIWGSGKDYPELLHSWGVSDIEKFWEVFDEEDLKLRRNLIKNKELVPYEGINEILEELIERRYELAALTNSDQHIAEIILGEFSLLKYFKVIKGLDKYKTPSKVKPEPGNLLELLEEMGYSDKRDRVLLVGDSPTDILVAKRANIKSLLLDPWDEISVFHKNELKEIEVIKIKHLNEIFHYLD